MPDLELTCHGQYGNHHEPAVMEHDSTPPESWTCPTCDTEVVR